MTSPIDTLSIAQALVRCPSVTPADAGALGVLEELPDLVPVERAKRMWGFPARMPGSRFGKSPRIGKTVSGRLMVDL